MLRMGYRDLVKAGTCLCINMMLKLEKKYPWYTDVCHFEMHRRYSYFCQGEIIHKRPDMNINREPITQWEDNESCHFCLVHNNLIWYPICEISWIYLIRFRSYDPDRNFSQGQIKKARVVILVNKIFSWVCPIWFRSYDPDTNFSQERKKKTKKTRVVIFVRDTLSRYDIPHPWSFMNLSHMVQEIRPGHEFKLRGVNS